MTRKEIVLGLLKALSADIGTKWAKYANSGPFNPGCTGKTPTLETLLAIEDLTRLYKDGRTLYEAGDYLGCIALLTKDEVDA